MKTSRHNIKVRAFWYDKTMPWKDFVVSVGRIIGEVNRLFPDLKRYTVMDDPKEHDIVISPDLSDLDDKLMLQMDYDQNFINDDANDKSFNRNSHSWFGFHAGWAFATGDGEKEIWASYDDGCRLRVNVRGEVVHGANNIILRIDPQFHDSVAETLLRLCIDMFHPAYAYAGRMAASSHLHQPVGDNWIGWLTYLRDGADVRGYLPAGIETETVREGLLIRADDHPCQADDEAGVNKLWEIYHALEPHGFLVRTQP